jgi:hypothetical protein
MKTESSIIEVPIEYKKVIELSQGAIEARHLLKFFYESKNGNKGERIIRPYMIIPRNGKLELVGVPITELSKLKRQAGHYTISQLKERFESEQFEVLDETFNDPGIPREKVDNTQTTPAYRFIYDEENAKEVKAEWLQIKYV